MKAEGTDAMEKLGTAAQHPHYALTWCARTTRWLRKAGSEERGGVRQNHARWQESEAPGGCRRASSAQRSNRRGRVLPARPYRSENHIEVIIAWRSPRRQTYRQVGRRQHEML